MFESILCHSRGVNQEIKYRGMVATAHRVEFIRKLIADNPDESRNSLSIKLCKAWNWVQSNGRMRDMVCRGFMLELHRAGVITLPEKRFTPNNPLGGIRKKPAHVEVDASAITGSIKELKPFEIRQVRHTADEKLHAGLIEQYHYLGYSHPVGEQGKYVVFVGERPVGCFSFSAASRHVAARDRFIGWDAEQRKKTSTLLPTIRAFCYCHGYLCAIWLRICWVG